MTALPKVSDEEQFLNALNVGKAYSESILLGEKFCPSPVNVGISVEKLRKRLKKFAEYEVAHPSAYEDALWYVFPNGYGISIMRNEHTYGASEGLWEAALVKDKTIVYRDDVFDGNVAGYLTPTNVQKCVEQVMSLEPD